MVVFMVAASRWAWGRVDARVFRSADGGVHRGSDGWARGKMGGERVQSAN
jgi:hypothetical protein